MPDSREQDRAQLVDRLRLDRSAPATGSRWRTRRWLAAAAAGGAALVALWVIRGGQETPVVRIATARPAGAVTSDTSVLDASGYVVARREATVSAKITGKVTEVLIEEGMRVEAGAVLARLDSTEARAQLDLARARLEAARSDLEVLRADLAQAERDFVRLEELHRDQIASRQEYERARAERDTLRARIASAVQQIAVASEAVGVAQVQLDDTEIRAPFAGVVVAKAAQPGEMISPISAGGGFTRTGIGTIVDMDSLEIEVDVNESFIGRVSAGQPVEATLNAYPEWSIPGKVIAVIPTADRSKATIKVRVSIDTKDPRIVPEMGVRVAFLGGGDAARTGVWIPGDAIVTRDGEQVVFVVEDGRADRRKVSVGDSTQSDRQVLSGVAAGEIVIASPPAELDDGARVRSSDGG